MTDLGFIETKCELGMTHDLVSDYVFLYSVREEHEILNEETEKSLDKIEEFHKFVRNIVHVVQVRARK
jgi:hypothetical protein